MENNFPNGTAPNLPAWWRRFFLVALFAVWWGGFTFYALIVIPTGHQVLRSKIRQGFITQQVTQKMNYLCAVLLALLALELYLASRQKKEEAKLRMGWTAWGIMVVCLCALWLIHGRMDALLDFQSRSVIDDNKFYAVHRIYLLVATTQWLAGLFALSWILNTFKLLSAKLVSRNG
ncbi:MAG: hypothetical protein M3Y82_10740 [Verrucomicrobiota bacterium]|nr:hypothetical protein [Verrucomicrobiota bacterium]